MKSALKIFFSTIAIPFLAVAAIAVILSFCMFPLKNRW